MSDPQNDPPFEEQAALHALGLLDETGRRELLDAAQQDARVDRLAGQFAEAAALLAYEAPQIEPPPGMRMQILRLSAPRRLPAKVIPFAAWIPYAIAASLMILGMAEAWRIAVLKAQLRSEHTQWLAASAETARLNRSNALIGLRLATLEAKDAAYASSKVMVAWDPAQHRGVFSLQNLPAPPPGHDYQLWVLDPHATAPISAGLITGSRTFAVNPLSTASPGFAISLEPSGGRPEPTGPILFAVAPGP
jgi:anti-sigma-K factor RskA